MQVKLEIYVIKHWGMIRPLKKWQLRLISLISLYSDAGLNILGLAVFPSAQGRGIGRQLIKRVEELAKSKHYAFIRLNSASHRKEAHVFYERIGYEGNKTQKRFLKIMN